jgi:hypothetical protein
MVHKGAGPGLGVLIYLPIIVFSSIIFCIRVRVRMSATSWVNVRVRVRVRVRLRVSGYGYPSGVQTVYTVP